MQCPECGADVRPGTTYCPECGSEINMPDTDSGSEDSLAAKIPGMKAGSTGRNVAVGALYVFILLGVLGAAAPDTESPDAADEDEGLDDPTATEAGAGETPADTTEPPTTETDGGTAPADTDTPAPTATPTAEPTATPRPEPETQSYSGSGQAVTDTVTIEGGLTTFSMEHDGDSNFQVELIDESDGDTEEYLANEIGEWQADQPYYIPPGEYVLDVNADGNWNIDVAQPRPAPSDVSELPASTSDQYPSYIGPVRFDGLHTISAQYNGDGNFAVWVLDEDGQRQDLIFNEIGEFEGQSTYSGNHVGYIRIEATGDYELDVE